MSIVDVAANGPRCHFVGCSSARKFEASRNYLGVLVMLCQSAFRLGPSSPEALHLDAEPITAAVIRRVEGEMLRRCARAMPSGQPKPIRKAGGASSSNATVVRTPAAAAIGESLRDADPDVVVVLPCGFDLARTRAEMGPLTAQPGWSELRAVREGRVYLTDGNQYFNRPGPRLVESLEILAETLHPDHFPARHRDHGWQPL